MCTLRLPDPCPRDRETWLGTRMAAGTLTWIPWKSCCRSSQLRRQSPSGSGGGDCMSLSTPRDAASGEDGAATPAGRRRLRHRPRPLPGSRCRGCQREKARRNPSASPAPRGSQSRPESGTGRGHVPAGRLLAQGPNVGAQRGSLPPTTHGARRHVLPTL